jgi:hypothetical protein
VRRVNATALHVAALLLVAAAHAQAQTAPILVLVEQPPPVLGALYEVDPVTGAVAPLAGFPGLFATPRAVAVDPYNGDVILVRELQTPGGPAPQWSRWRRVGLAAWTGATFFQTDCRQIAVQDQRLPCVTGASLASVTRRQSTPTLLHVQPNLDAMDVEAPGATIAVAWSGQPGTTQADSGTALVDGITGALLAAPATFPNPSGRTTTGIVELPTAIPRQLLSFSDGSFAMFAPAIAPTPQAISTSMPIPSGGAVALKAGGSAAARPLALGGAAFPFLYEIDPFSGVITLRSAALPGNPIDFAIGIDRTAHVVAFGSACGPAAVQALPTNPPTLGSTLVLSAAGQPNAILLLMLGLDDIAGNTLPTPLPFAGGCLLHITPDLLLAFATGPSGQASHAIPLPSGPQFVAMPLFAQWAQLDVAGFSLGEANAYFLGN